MSKELTCKECYKEIMDCECSLKSMMGGEGFCSAHEFGERRIEYNWLEMDGQFVLKLKLFNDSVYLNDSGIRFLNSITNNYINTKKSMYEKSLLDWDCNGCGKKTNNSQEWCDDCISAGRDEECDCY